LTPAVKERAAAALQPKTVCADSSSKKALLRVFGEFCCSSALADPKIELSVTFCTDHRREHS